MPGIFVRKAGLDGVASEVSGGFNPESLGFDGYDEVYVDSNKDPFTLVYDKVAQAESLLRGLLVRYATQNGRVRVSVVRASLPKRVKVNKNSTFGQMLFKPELLIGKAIGTKWLPEQKCMVLSVMFNSHGMEGVVGQFRIYPKDVVDYNRYTGYNVKPHFKKEDGEQYSLGLVDMNTMSSNTVQ